MANIGKFEVGTTWTKLENVVGTSISVGVTYLIQNTGFPSLLLCELPIAPSGDIGFTINKNEKLKYIRNQGSFLWVRAFSNTTTFNIAETTDTDLDSYPFQLKDNISQDYNNNSEVTYPSSKALKNAISNIQQNIGDGLLTLQQNGTTIGTFSANSSENKTINITGGGGSSNLIFNNISAANWVADNTYEDYSYKCDLDCNGVTASMFATVVFNLADSQSGNYANVCVTGTNIVTIYSKVNDSITIPTIIAEG